MLTQGLKMNFLKQCLKYLDSIFKYYSPYFSQIEKNLAIKSHINFRVSLS